MFRITAIGLIAFNLAACYPAHPVDHRTPPDPYFSAASQPTATLLSYGMVKRSLMPGRTTQAEVLQQFGAPNNMTYQGNGEELWIYDQVVSETTTNAKAENANLGFGLFSANDSRLFGFRAGAGQQIGSAASRSTLKTLTVILSFDARGILQDVTARKGGY